MNISLSSCCWSVRARNTKTNTKKSMFLPVRNNDKVIFINAHNIYLVVWLTVLVIKQESVHHWWLMQGIMGKPDPKGKCWLVSSKNGMRPGILDILEHGTLLCVVEALPRPKCFKPQRNGHWFLDHIYALCQKWNNRKDWIVQKILVQLQTYNSSLQWTPSL